MPEEERAPSSLFDVGAFLMTPDVDAGAAIIHNCAATFVVDCLRVHNHVGGPEPLARVGEQTGAAE